MQTWDDEIELGEDVVVDWGSIVAQHGPVVLRTAFRLLANHADALDCYQDTFIAAWRFAEHGEVASWAPFLVSVATHRAIQRLRQRAGARKRLLKMDCSSQVRDYETCPVQAAQARELLDRVRQRLSLLPKKHAEVIWLNGVEGLTHRQISAHLQITPNEVGVLLHRARSRLRAALASDSERDSFDHETLNPVKGPRTPCQFSRTPRSD
jgi:RNA polymerase sigma-70 factor, ECF subfamily